MIINNKATNIDYDIENDSLYIYAEGQEYKDSLDLNDIIIDFNKEGSVMGIEVLDASKKFKLSKFDLKNIVEFKSTIFISKDIVKIEMKISILKRNRMVEKSVIAKGLNDVSLSEGTLAISC
ncbi:DUF2283 domain-containing protein [Methanotorris igneus]|uniref:DUF2283 domain-containing protein n=1 Tax=Methanotorris igneus (strain DSM 5666 / JCM 11834 / Kol 5) TaxID=880724 RepID=F6BCX3_METIK|nr:DUF2283 domain-containing protein [Methanotorris igneus]AEF96334.1 Protein of unknown function DUF2283 [Methanotorris igneus Kol 5]